MEDNKLTEFEEKIVAIYKECLFAEHFPETFLRRLREIMPPTCTPNERKFLDEIREKGKYHKNHDFLSIINSIRGTNIFIEDFESNLSELVEKEE